MYYCIWKRQLPVNINALHISSFQRVVGQLRCLDSSPKARRLAWKYICWAGQSRPLTRSLFYMKDLTKFMIIFCPIFFSNFFRRYFLYFPIVLSSESSRTWLTGSVEPTRIHWWSYFPINNFLYSSVFIETFQLSTAW